MNPQNSATPAAHKIRIPKGPSGKWRTTWRILSDPRGFFEECVERYGDPFQLTAINGPVAVTGRPELVEQIFRGDPDTFSIFASDAMKPILGAGSLLMLDGKAHRAERKRVAPPLHGDRMRVYGEAMQATALSMAAKYLPGQPFTGIQLGTEISLDVILQAVFGADSVDLLERFRCTTRLALHRSWPILFFSPKSQFKFLGLSPMDRLQSAQQQLHALMRDELAKRGASIHEREDILSILARPTEEEPELDFQHFADSLGTLLFAGHETTAVTIAWAMYHLHRSPEWLARLRTELDASDGRPETYAKMPLLQAIIDETLRLNPIVTEVLRKLRKPFQLGEFELPAGGAVAAASCLTHYNHDIFPNPEAFDPSRHLDRTYTPSQFYPFGGGHRRCVGAAFANFELAIVLGTILGTYEFELLDKKPVVAKRRNITMGPSTGVRLRLTRRR